MSGRHIKALIAAYHAGDDLAFRRATQGIIEEEEAKRHTALAKDLRRLLGSGGRPVSTDAYVLPDPPRDRETNAPLLEVGTTDLALDDLVFPDPVATRLAGIRDEVAHWSALDAAGVPRRNRVLLYGPPGCGKTTVAAALAGELGLPLVVARIDSLISSYLGETAANLRSLFDYAADAPSVVLLDEFDSLGKLRDDPADHGELRRVVNAVLQMIDSYRGRSILIAATNNPSVLDSAIWRRFDEVVEIPLPGPDELTSLFQRLLHERFPSAAIRSAVEQMIGLPYAAVEHAVFGARRRAVIDGRVDWSDADLQDAVADTVSRPWL